VIHLLIVAAVILFVLWLLFHAAVRWSIWSGLPSSSSPSSGSWAFFAAAAEPSFRSQPPGQRSWPGSRHHQAL